MGEPFKERGNSGDLRRNAEYLRYRSAIGLRLSEFAIRPTAREWTQDYEWYVHQLQAPKAESKTRGARRAFRLKRSEQTRTALGLDSPGL
jgi:hypothetical protein